MLSLVGSVLGFVTSTGPGLFKMFMDAKQDQRDKEHGSTGAGQTRRGSDSQRGRSKYSCT